MANWPTYPPIWPPQSASRPTCRLIIPVEEQGMAPEEVWVLSPKGACACGGVTVVDASDSASTHAPWSSQLTSPIYEITEKDDSWARSNRTCVRIDIEL